MLIIRLKKIAFKNNLIYSIVIISPTKSAQSNQFIEKLGHYRPIIDKWSNKYTFINFNRVAFWLKRGARINKSVFFLIKSLIIYSKNITSKIIFFDLLWILAGSGLDRNYI